MSAEATVVEIIKWIRESIRPIVVLLIVSTLILFLPRSWLNSIGIADWLQRYRPWIILIFVTSLVWLGTFPIENQYHHQKRKGYLKQLTGEEQDV
ncbi:MAG: superinfection exclusion B family protein, partial [Acidobacteriia bacterium]|nr:superinfection exclusion B family protein [Terriglobia bacterium]